MADFGVDMAGATDITPTLLDTSGVPLLQDVAVRRLTTPNGSLLSAPGALTVDIRLFLAADFHRDSRGSNIVKSSVVAALKDDQRFFTVSASVVWEVDDSMTVGINVDTAEGPFDLTLSVTRVTVAVLQR